MMLLNKLIKTIMAALIFIPLTVSSQLPLYYKIKKVEGEIFKKDAASIGVRIQSRRKLTLKNCQDKNLESFLHTLMITRISRQYLEHLNTTSANITVDLTNKVGILLKDGKYRLIAGITVPSETQSDSLIIDQSSNFRGKRRRDPVYVFEENTITIFEKSIVYARSEFSLDSSNTILIDAETNQRIEIFSMDTIQIEPLMNPDLLYANCQELYYFTGIHEIFHTTARNIDVQLEDGGDAEYDAYILERRAFKDRARINKKRIVICNENP